MKRLLLGIALLGSAAVLGGCPIYSGEQETVVCDSQACYSCPGNNYTSACTPLACQSSFDCPSGYECDPNALACVAPGGFVGPDGSPAEASSSGCAISGCPAGQICKLAGGVLACVPVDQGDATSSDTGAPPDASMDAALDVIVPPDSPVGDGGTDGAGNDGGGDGGDGGVLGAACNDDPTCGGAGAKCIDGRCRTQVQLCSDGSQCNAKGYACVDGVCEPTCSATKSSCPAGYQCDVNRNACNVNPAPCAGSGTSTCLGGTVCVDTHCVAPCSATDAGASCPSRQTCVNGGCLPDQAASFACTNDGVSGPVANRCPADAVCLHHDCYTSCSGDAGACGAAGSTGATCKSVTIETGTYAVCGSTTTLGSQCDPAQGVYCGGGAVCVNGFCL